LYVSPKWPAFSRLQSYVRFRRAFTESVTVMKINLKVGNFSIMAKL